MATTEPQKNPMRPLWSRAQKKQEFMSGIDTIDKKFKELRMDVQSAIQKNPQLKKKRDWYLENFTVKGMKENCVSVLDPSDDQIEERLRIADPLTKWDCLVYLVL